MKKVVQGRIVSKHFVPEILESYENYTGIDHFFGLQVSASTEAQTEKVKLNLKM